MCRQSFGSASTARSLVAVHVPPMSLAEARTSAELLLLGGRMNAEADKRFNDCECCAFAFIRFAGGFAQALSRIQGSMMSWKSAPFAALSLVLSVIAAHAQEFPQRVRLTTADSAGERRWTGYIKRLTPDSVELRVVSAAPDTFVTFARTAIRLAERQTPPVSRQRAAVVGCAMGGSALGAVGFSGPDQSGDYSGMKKINGVLGVFLGCPIGVVVAVLVSRGQRWEPWLLPE
jgi:hypothetical protein